MENINTRDFNIKVIKSLKQKGISIYRKTWLPDSKGDFTNGETGYVINDNGTSRVKTYLEILALAKKENNYEHNE
jgi:hypothetical protein